MGFAREVADRILFMDAGRVLERAPPEDFFTRSQHPRVREFLADIRTPFAPLDPATAAPRGEGV
jgi:ABC-type polar amino acid transport system ATPase subunit